MCSVLYGAVRPDVGTGSSNVVGSSGISGTVRPDIGAARSRCGTVRHDIWAARSRWGTVKDNICQAVEKEYNKITVQLAEQKARALHKCRRVPFFKELLSHVSHHALLQLYEQYEKLQLGTMHEQCTGNFEATMGLPCAHTMMRWIYGTLPLHLIHQQWRIDRTLAPSDSTHGNDDGIESLFDECKAKYQEWPRHKKDTVRRLLAELLDREMPCEPEIPRPKSTVQRQKRSRAASSTRRDPSQFEFVEASHRSQERVVPMTNNESDDTTMFNLEDLTEFADFS